MGGCLCPHDRGDLRRSLPPGVRGRHRAQDRRTAGQRVARRKHKEQGFALEEETASLLGEKKQPRFEVVAFPVRYQYGNQDFFFVDKQFLHKEWREREDVVRAVEEYVASRNHQALGKADVKKMAELGCPWPMVETILASQLRHLILWEESLLMRFCILASGPSAEAIAEGKSQWSGKGLEDLRQQQAEMERLHPNEWFSKMEFHGPGVSPVSYPPWVLDKYMSAVPACNAKFSVSVPVVRGSGYLHRDIYRRDQDLMSKDDVHVVLCLENGEYAGHIYTWTRNGVQVAQGIRSSIWKNTLGMCSGTPSGVATKLLEGVRRFAQAAGSPTVEIEAPLYSMFSTLEKHGFIVKGKNGLSASRAWRTVAAGTIATLDSFTTFPAGL